LSEIYALSPNDWLGIVTRLGNALLVGAIIGLEREIKDKPAGLRTHMLVSFGAALFILVPILIGAAERSGDALPRVIQGIVAGVGFLGAGEILRESRPQRGKVKIRGLTSAAAIWISAALGVAAGCGLWLLSLIAAVVTLLVLRVFKELEP
jgi:putative Mg2+ transporter-C (MgtC) family protein